MTTIHDLGQAHKTGGGPNQPSRHSPLRAKGKKQRKQKSNSRNQTESYQNLQSVYHFSFRERVDEYEKQKIRAKK